MYKKVVSGAGYFCLCELSNEYFLNLMIFGFLSYPCIVEN